MHYATLKMTVALVVCFAVAAGASAEGQKEGTAAGPVKLEVMYGGAPLETGQMLEEAIKLWNTQQSKIVVEVQMVPGTGYWDKFKVLMASKQLPDILRSDDDWVGEYFVRDQFLDLTDLIKKEVDISKIWKDSWKAFMWKDRIYTLPYKADVVALYYNKKLTRESGVPALTENPMSYEDFLSICQKTTKEKGGRADTFGFGIRVQWLYPQAWVWRWGGSLFNREKTRSTLTDPPAVTALQTYVDLRHKYKVAPSASLEKEEGSETVFKAGRMAMWEAGNWGIWSYRKQRDAGTLDFGIVMPNKGPVNSLTRATYEGWAMPTYAKHKKEAWEVMKWLSTGATAQQFLARSAAIPIMKDVAYSDAFNQPGTPEDESIFLRILERNSHISEFLLQGAEMDTLWNNSMDGLFLGTKTAAEATAAFSAAIQKTIDNEKQYRPYADPDMKVPE